MENLGSDGALFQQFGMSLKLLSNHILQKLPAANRILEKATIQDSIEFLENETGLFRVNLDWARLFVRMTRTLDCKTHGFPC